MSPENYSLYEQAQQAMEMGALQTALKLIEKAKLSPEISDICSRTKADILSKLAIEAEEIGGYDKALDYIDQALACENISDQSKGEFAQIKFGILEKQREFAKTMGNRDFIFATAETSAQALMINEISGILAKDLPDLTNGNTISLINLTAQELSKEEINKIIIDLDAGEIEWSSLEPATRMAFVFQTQILPWINSLGLELHSHSINARTYIKELQSLCDYYGDIEMNTGLKLDNLEKSFMTQLVRTFILKNSLTQFEESILMDAYYKLATISMNAERPELAVALLDKCLDHKNKEIAQNKGLPEENNFHLTRLLTSKVSALAEIMKNSQDQPKEENISQIAECFKQIFTTNQVADTEKGFKNKTLAIFNSQEPFVRHNIYNILHIVLQVIIGQNKELFNQLGIKNNEIGNFVQEITNKLEEAIVDEKNEASADKILSEQDSNLLEIYRLAAGSLFQEINEDSFLQAEKYIQKAREMAEKIGDHIALQNISEFFNQLLITYKNLIEGVSDMRLRVIELVVNLIEEKDPQTGNHSRNVRLLSEQLAQLLGAPSGLIEEIGIAAMLHDLGKLKVPQGILTKEGKLSSEEWGKIKEHPQSGYSILKQLDPYLRIIMELALQAALHHHENWNGGGYPNDLKDKDIPLIGRIAKIADVFEAISSNRCYMKGLKSLSEITAIIINDIGTHFDPEIAHAFLVNYRGFVEIIAQQANNHQETKGEQVSERFSEEEMQIVNFLEEFFKKSENIVPIRNLFEEDQKEDLNQEKRKEIIEQLRQEFEQFCKKHALPTKEER